MRAHRACSEGKHRSSVKKESSRTKVKPSSGVSCLSWSTEAKFLCLFRTRRAHQKTLSSSRSLKILLLWPVVSALWLTKHLLQGVGPAASLTSLLLTCFHEPTTAKLNYLLQEAEESIRTPENNHFFFFLPNTSAHCICLCGIFLGKAAGEGHDSVYMEHIQIPYDQYWLRTLFNKPLHTKSKDWSQSSFVSFCYPTRVWEFALNIHAYVSYLAATTSFSVKPRRGLHLLYELQKRRKKRANTSQHKAN